ncbi:MAG: hypothetical protein FWH29_03475 [Methanobrevibacter sp.]|nr:hypothetical protein [Methanobrevibacter sp.]
MKLKKTLIIAIIILLAIILIWVILVFYLTVIEGYDIFDILQKSFDGNVNPNELLNYLNQTDTNSDNIMNYLNESRG